MVILMKGRTDGGCWDEAVRRIKGGCQDWMMGVLIRSRPIERFLEVQWHGVHRKTYSSLHSAGEIVRAGWPTGWMSE